MAEVTPIFASSIFTITRFCEVYQVINYDYFDPEGYYEQILHDEPRFAIEIKSLRKNMERFLAAERITINGQLVQQDILHVDIGLRGAANVPYIQWVIFFQGHPREGQNSLVSDVLEEIAEYDIEVLYLWPYNTQITQVKTAMEFDIQKSLLFVWARKGDKVGGHEEVLFEFPKG